MAKIIGLYEWLTSVEILGYIINAHAGVEPLQHNPGILRRIFLWEEDGEVKMGNTEAFMLHLGRRFDRKVSEGDAPTLHKLMRDLGESVSFHKKHAPRSPDGPKAGRYRQPEPDEWVINPSSRRTAPRPRTN